MKVVSGIEEKTIQKPSSYQLNENLMFTKLVIGMCRANVVTGAQDSFDNECRSHGVEQSVVLRNTVKLARKSITRILKFKWSINYFLKAIVSFLSFPLQDISASRVDDEQQSEQHVANVRVDVVEIGQIAQRMGAQEIEITQVLIAYTLFVTHALLLNTSDKVTSK